MDITEKDLNQLSYRLDMEAALEESVRDSYGRADKHQPRSNNASRCGHPCPFYLWAIRARWEELPSPDDGMPGVWRVGREQERAIKSILLEQGWNLTYDEVTFEDPDLDIRGKLDFYLSHKAKPGWQDPVPTEFKSVSPTYFSQIRSFEDCFRSPMPWVRLWPYQPLIYAYLAPEEYPLVCLLLRNKGNGKVKAIVEKADDHFGLLVEMGDVLAEVNQALADPDAFPEGPAPMTYKPSWCDGCDAKAICPTMRSVVHGGTVVALDDPSEIDRLAEEYYFNEAAKKAAGVAWDEIKAHCKHYGAYDGTPGETRTLIGEKFIFEVKQGKKSATLKVKPLSEADDNEAADE